MSHPYHTFIPDSRIPILLYIEPIVQFNLSTSVHSHRIFLSFRKFTQVADGHDNDEDLCDSLGDLWMISVEDFGRFFLQITLQIEDVNVKTAEKIETHSLP